MSTTDSATPVGRRDRNMREKRERIFRATTELFHERGFAAVTTQEISERADVAAGTLFRYASSKSELLLMAYNEILRHTIETGMERSRAFTEPVDIVLAMVTPIVANAAQSPENSIAYQRELLFGSPEEEYRSAGLDLISGLESTIAERLMQARPSLDPEEARLASMAVFAVMHMTIARLSTGAHAGHDTLEDLRGQISQVLAGALDPPPHATTHHQVKGTP